MGAKARATCPICRKAVAKDGEFVPFCSARCKMVDLGRWFRGEYVVAGEAAVAFDPELGDAGSSSPDDGGGSSEPEA